MQTFRQRCRNDDIGFYSMPGVTWCTHVQQNRGFCQKTWAFWVSMMHLPFPRGASGDFTQSAPDLLIRSKSWKPLCQHSWSVGAPARHPVPEHFRQFCQKCSGSSKSEIEVPCPVSLPRQRNFQNTKHSPICGQYLCKHRAKISFAHLQGLPPDPYAACGRKLRR